MKYAVMGITIFLFALTSTVNAETKNEKIIRVLEVTNALDLGQQVHDTVIQQLAPLFPEEAAPILMGVSESLKGEEFKNLMVKLHDKFYSEAEIDAMLKFYSSKEGKSIIKKMPAVMQESMQVGNMFGQMQARKIIQEMKDKGYEPRSI